MKYIGYPVAGDTIYGLKRDFNEETGQYLHAKTIGFNHPRTGEYMEFTSELPPYFESFLEQLRREKENSWFDNHI